MNYNNCTAKLLVKFVKNNFSKVISVNTAYNTLHKLNYSKTRCKKISGKAKEEDLEKFKENLFKIISSKDSNVQIIYEDESIMTSEETTTSVWSKIEKQTELKTNGNKRKRKVIFGVVSPSDEKLTEQYSDRGNSKNFCSFLK